MHVMDTNPFLRYIIQKALLLLLWLIKGRLKSSVSPWPTSVANSYWFFLGTGLGLSLSNLSFESRYLHGILLPCKAFHYRLLWLSL